MKLVLIEDARITSRAHLMLAQTRPFAPAYNSLLDIYEDIKLIMKKKHFWNVDSPINKTDLLIVYSVDVKYNLQMFAFSFCFLD